MTTVKGESETELCVRKNYEKVCWPGHLAILYELSVIWFTFLYCDTNKICSLCLLQAILELIHKSQQILTEQGLSLTICITMPTSCLSLFSSLIFRRAINKW